MPKCALDGLRRSFQIPVWLTIYAISERCAVLVPFGLYGPLGQH